VVGAHLPGSLWFQPSSTTTSCSTTAPGSRRRPVAHRDAGGAGPAGAPRAVPAGAGRPGGRARRAGPTPGPTTRGGKSDVWVWVPDPRTGTGAGRADRRAGRAAAARGRIVRHELPHLCRAPRQRRLVQAPGRPDRQVGGGVPAGRARARAAGGRAGGGPFRGDAVARPPRRGADQGVEVVRGDQQATSTP
jgi:hypothetical protein